MSFGLYAGILRYARTNISHNFNYSYFYDGHVLPRAADLKAMLGSAIVAVATPVTSRRKSAGTSARGALVPASVQP